MPKFPYAQPIGALGVIIDHLRKSFPETVDAAVLKKLTIAPNNESYIINTIRFLGVTDAESTRTDKAHEIFLKGDEDFSNEFANLVRTAYSDLFELHGDEAWELVPSKLVSFFRTEDKSTELVGTRQANTFIKLAEIAGMRKPSVASRNGDGVKRRTQTSEQVKIQKKVSDRAGKSESSGISGKKGARVTDASVALAVKIEVNLPPTTDQQVYDAIFKSIKANLLDRE
ncbi:DUF5343 domain-containing protein [Kamptonema cortianum]|nr:DUF5343 domain-containing protein [Geitlerinema splendidum]MDK3158652.1 DUF5343 domain-containing protein [Kamptonema cortianum]